MTQRMKNIINKKFYLYGIVFLIIIWFALAYIFKDNSFVFPNPIDTIKYTLYLLGKTYTYICIYNSLKLMIVGFGLAFVFGVVLGIISGNSKKIFYCISPFMVVLRSFPTVSLIYLFIVIFGYEYAPALLVCVIALPIIYQGVLYGIENIESNLVESIRIDGANIFEENLFLKIPLSIPSIVSSIVSSFSLSFKVEIMAEVISGGYVKGIGSAINGARISDPTNMTSVFAYSLIAILVMLLIDRLSRLFID